jgi:AcrR family transcriptional regulator
VTAALRRIQTEGVAALTLRAVGQDLGVSRTALYRHFADKAALLEAVATDGFRRFRAALLTAWEEVGRGRAGLAAMGEAYVRFALEHGSHYRVMFGGVLYGRPVSDPDLVKEGRAAFQVLVAALVDLQETGAVRREDPSRQAFFVWSTVHGIAMLSIDRQLPPQGGDPIALVRFALECVVDGIGVDKDSGQSAARKR